MPEHVVDRLTNGSAEGVSTSQQQQRASPEASGLRRAAICGERFELIPSCHFSLQHVVSLSTTPAWQLLLDITNFVSNGSAATA